MASLGVVLPALFNNAVGRKGGMRMEPGSIVANAVIPEVHLLSLEVCGLILQALRAGYLDFFTLRLSYFLLKQFLCL
jgi:hypothetical protein